jgi:hypothetical protein
MAHSRLLVWALPVRITAHCGSTLTNQVFQPVRRKSQNGYLGSIGMPVNMSFQLDLENVVYGLLRIDQFLFAGRMPNRSR